MDIDMNLNQTKCKECGGTVSLQRFDMNCIYFLCESCGNESTYAFQSEEEAQFYMEEEKQALFGRLREGFIDWQATDWNRLYTDFDEFLNAHPEYEDDLRFRMALVACLTSGFNRMDREKYSQCKGRFKAVDKMYRSRLKLLKAQIASPALSEAIDDYRTSRTKYVLLRNEYLQTKMIWKMVWSIAKFWLQ